VAPFDINATEEITDLRVTLECKLGLKAVNRLSKKDLDELRDLQDQIEEASAKGDRDAVRSINYRFHELIYQAADLPPTLRFVRTLWARYPFDLINKLDNRIDRASEEHREMLQALIARDEAAFLQALRTHIRSAWAEFKTSYSE
jgi:DNA-binding GntR family transcriptional regulator